MRVRIIIVSFFFFFNDTATTEIYTLSLHDALPIYQLSDFCSNQDIVVIHDAARPLISQRIINENIESAKINKAVDTVIPTTDTIIRSIDGSVIEEVPVRRDRKSTRLNSSHANISYAVFCLKKKKTA